MADAETQTAMTIRFAPPKNGDQAADDEEEVVDENIPSHARSLWDVMKSAGLTHTAHVHKEPRIVVDAGVGGQVDDGELLDDDSLIGGDVFGGFGGGGGGGSASKAELDKKIAELEEQQNLIEELQQQLKGAEVSGLFLF